MPVGGRSKINRAQTVSVHQQPIKRGVDCPLGKLLVHSGSSLVLNSLLSITAARTC